MRQAARLLACVFVASLAAPAIAAGHGDGVCPDRCLEMTLGWAHDGEHLEGVRPPLDADHCALCHWLRDVNRAAPRPATSAAVTFDRAVGIADETASAPCRLVADGQPSRAPPRPSY
jgi:hypothetical protein